MSEHPPKSLPWIRARLLDEVKGLKESVDRLGDIIEDKVKPSKPRPVEAMEILEQVSHETGVTVDELVGPRGSPEICRARELAMERVRDLTDLSYPAIGRLFGNRHHSTVIAAIQRRKRNEH